MIYTVYETSFMLPGANPEQTVYEKWESQKAFLEHFIEMVEDCADALFRLESDSEESFDELLGKLHKLKDDEKAETLDLNGFQYDIGCFRAAIHAAAPYPEIRDLFFEKAEEIVAEYFEEYEDLEEDEYEDYEGEELFDLYILWNKVKDREEPDEENFDALFDATAEFFEDNAVF